MDVFFWIGGGSGLLALALTFEGLTVCVGTDYWVGPWDI